MTSSLRDSILAMSIPTIGMATEDPVRQDVEFAFRA